MAWGRGRGHAIASTPRHSDSITPRPDREAREALLAAGRLTMVYTDIAGSTGLTRRLGDAAAHALILAHDRVVRDAVGAHGGIELQTLGDGFKLAFADPGDAIDAAVAIQSGVERMEGYGAQPSVRIGIHEGVPIREGGDLVGEAAILAQRIMSRATPNRILIDAESLASAGTRPGVRTVDLGVYHLKGFEHGIQLHEVVWRVDAPASDAPDVASLKPAWRTPFLGRDTELRFLEEAFDAADRGEGRIVVICGDAGSGKSRLAFEFLDRMTRRPLAPAAARAPRGLGVNFEPVVEWLRQLRDVLRDPSLSSASAAALAPLANRFTALRDWIEPIAASPGDTEERPRLIGALADRLVEWSREQPLLLLLDDLHWADDGTLDVLRVLGMRLARGGRDLGARILVVATSVESDREDVSSYARCLAELERDRVLVMAPLQPLDRDAVERLLRELRGAPPGRGLCDFVYERSQGNPYFVEEIFRDLVETTPGPSRDADWNREAIARGRRVPKAIERVLGQRLSRLSRECLDVLRGAALIGGPFDPALLCAALDLPMESLLLALDEAMMAGVVDEREVGARVLYAFHHNLIAEVTAEQSSLARRQQLHLSLARAFDRAELQAASPEPALSIAHHLERAGDLAPPAEVVRHAVPAAELAAGIYDWRRSDHFYALALAALARLPDADERERAELEVRRVATLGRTGRPDAARALGDRAIRVFERLGDEAGAQRARAAIADCLVLHAKHRDALPYLERAAANLPEPIDAAHARLLTAYATALDLAGRSEDMRRIADSLLALARRLRNARLLERALLIERNWYANHTADIARARQLSRRAQRIAERSGEAWDLALRAESVGFFELCLGRLDAALEALGASLAQAQRTGVPAKILDVRALRAVCFCLRGEWDRVGEEWELTGEERGATPGSLRFGQLIWARTRMEEWLMRGAPVLPAPEDTYAGISQFRTAMLAGAGRMASERGDPQAARLLEAAAKCHPRDGVGLNWLPAAQSLAAGWTFLGDAERAGEWYPSLSPYRPAVQLGPVAIELARIAALQGRRDASQDDLEAALRIARRGRMRPYVALALLHRARCGPRSAATAARAEARADALFASLGMHSYRERLESDPVIARSEAR